MPKILKIETCVTDKVNYDEKNICMKKKKQNHIFFFGQELGVVRKE